MQGCLNRWEVNGWRNTKGARIRHSDIWRCIQRWLRLFEESPDRSVEVTHVRAHVGTEGNKRADGLAKKGGELRFELMKQAVRNDWFQNSLHEYWSNRKQNQKYLIMI